MKHKKLVHGVGINDADYVVKINEIIGYKEDGERILKLVWICPFYRKWKDMLQRCYSEKYKLKHPTYKECSVIEQWHSLMVFRKWMIEQDWQGKQLDKDILFPDNKIYSPEACVFVSHKVNSFLTESTASRGEWPIGVYLDKVSGKFKSQCWDVLKGKQKSLGTYTDADDAHQAWLDFKLGQARILAGQQSDPRVAKALISRYENYK